MVNIQAKEQSHPGQIRELWLSVQNGFCRARPSRLKGCCSQVIFKQTRSGSSLVLTSLHCSMSNKKRRKSPAAKAGETIMRLHDFTLPAAFAVWSPVLRVRKSSTLILRRRLSLPLSPEWRLHLIYKPFRQRIARQFIQTVNGTQFFADALVDRVGSNGASSVKPTGLCSAGVRY